MPVMSPITDEGEVEDEGSVGGGSGGLHRFSHLLGRIKGECVVEALRTCQLGKGGASLGSVQHSAIGFKEGSAIKVFQIDEHRRGKPNRSAEAGEERVEESSGETEALRHFFLFPPILSGAESQRDADQWREAHHEQPSQRKERVGK